MKYGAVIDSFAYVFVLLMSWLILKEKITKGKLIGNMIIIAGNHYLYDVSGTNRRILYDRI